MKNLPLPTLDGRPFMQRNRILAVALLAVLFVSLVAITTRDSVTANSASNIATVVAVQTPCSQQLTIPSTDGQIRGGGGVDKFRIKIWDKNNGDAVIYDNQMGAGIDDNPTTALAGGSIVVHK